MQIQVSKIGETLPLGKKAEPTPPDSHAAIQNVELLQRRKLTDNVFEIELTRPPSFEFKAGQTIRFIHETIERYYSPVSTPNDPTLTLCVYDVPQGRFSPILVRAEVGAAFRITGPHGYFTFNPSQRTPVFVATGTGIAPFVSMARSGIAGFIILHEVESAHELYYRDVFRKMASNYTPCLLAPSKAGPAGADTYYGNAAGFIKDNLPPARYDFYLCGERDMTREVTLLADEHFTGSYVFKEVFY
jgi:ferredoxin-NADP reductase